MSSLPSSSPSDTRSVRFLNGTLTVTFSPLNATDVEIGMDPHHRVIPNPTTTVTFSHTALQYNFSTNFATAVCSTTTNVVSSDIAPISSLERRRHLGPLCRKPVLRLPVTVPDVIVSASWQHGASRRSTPVVDTATDKRCSVDEDAPPVSRRSSVCCRRSAASHPSVTDEVRARQPAKQFHAA